MLIWRISDHFTKKIKEGISFIYLSLCVEAIESNEEIFEGKIIGGTLAGLAGAVALPVALPLLGFTSGGVAAGSIAASIQSAFYGGAAGGVFATAQERLHQEDTSSRI